MRLEADPRSGTRQLIERRSVVLWLSVGLYLAACAGFAAHTGGYIYGKDMAASWRWDGHDSLRGAQLLFTGWFGLLLGTSPCSPILHYG